MEDHVQSFHAFYKTTLEQSVALPTSIAERYNLCDCLRALIDKSTFFYCRTRQVERPSVSNMNQSELELMTTLTYFEYRGKLATISPVFQLPNQIGLMFLDTELTSVEGIESLKG